MRAKTGSLRDVSTPSGHLITADGAPLVFAIMANQVVRPFATRDWIDRTTAAWAAWWLLGRSCRTPRCSIRNDRSLRCHPRRKGPLIDSSSALRSAASGHVPAQDVEHLLERGFTPATDGRTTPLSHPRVSTCMPHRRPWWWPARRPLQHRPQEAPVQQGLSLANRWAVLRRQLADTRVQVHPTICGTPKPLPATTLQVRLRRRRDRPGRTRPDGATGGVRPRVAAGRFHRRRLHRAESPARHGLRLPAEPTTQRRSKSLGRFEVPEPRRSCLPDRPPRWW